ncbi:hypothetical protein C8R44DRAFT_974665 [Mycena epipterygia]|nr:hypothetical protein C8R44DRAFT_974665 [Mycena epipterygia]
MQHVAGNETYFLADLAAGLVQLALYLSDVGDNDGASAATAECEEVQKKIALLPPQPDFLFEEVVQEPEEETCKPEEILEDTVFLTLAESVIATTDSPAEAVVSETAMILISPDTHDIEVVLQVPVSMLPSPVVNPSREDTSEPANPRKSSLTDFLMTPLRLEVKINPWCILLGILFALVWSRK